MSKLIYSLISLFLLFSSIESNNSKYDNILRWAIDKGLEISPKLAMNYTDENERNFYLTEDVKENETLLKIPIDLTISTPKIMDYFKKNKRIKQLYKKINPEGTVNMSEEKDFRLEESFITGVLYILNHYPKKYAKSEFINFYQPFLDNFETNLEYFPFYYTKEQRALFQGTSFGGLFELADKMYNEDAQKLIEVLGFDIDMDIFARFRGITATKGINITGHYHLIPFTDMFYKNPVNFNVNLTINEETNTLNVYATKDIKEEEKLVFVTPYVPNVNSLLLFGTTYDETINYVKQFGIPMILGEFLESKGYNKEKADLNAKIELTEEKFYEKVMDVYKKFLKKINKESNELTALQLFLENLQFLRKGYDRSNPSVIYRTFIGKKSIQNAIRLMKTEINFIDDRIRIVEKVIEIFKEEIKKKEKEGKNKKDEKISDL